MSGPPSEIDLLLRELWSRMVVPESYSRRSLVGRLTPLLLTTALALIAVLGGMLACELTAPRPGTRSDPGGRSARRMGTIRPS